MFTLGPLEIIVGLGSNDLQAMNRLREARRQLRSIPEFKVLAHSRIYESEALLPPGAPPDWDRPFLNAALRIQVAGTPTARDLVARLKEIERTMGRAESARWAPRPIDLDLLAWGRPPSSDPEATVPHPGLMERPFALLPALDCVGSASAHPWRREVDVPQRTRISNQVWPEIVGILNLTPDSFSDGGKRVGRIEETVHELIREGADLIDVGAESTRPGATPLTWQEEWTRLEPAFGVLDRCARGVRISLDTYHSETARRALAAYPLTWLNDVRGFTDPEMRAVARAFAGGLVVMQDGNAPFGSWIQARRAELAREGLALDRLIFDPGLGFGKSAAENYSVLRTLEYAESPILIGHSRKRFLDVSGEVPAAERDLESAVVGVHAAARGADYLRVHSPATQLRALRVGARLR
jgi:2-amino-4-hydroxy-6-hydroxymethyldihydropteridine diphosphokinase/dihydropteroate synthase